VARSRTERIEFRVEDARAVVAAMERLAAAHAGWVNLLPQVRPEDEPPPRQGLTTLLAGAVHDIPVCTWVPGKRTRSGVKPDTIGVQHAVGTRVKARLVAAGLGARPGWRLLQDHPRRGLLVALPPGTALDEVVVWLLEAGAVLSAVRLSGEWRAEVHLPTEADRR